MAFIRAFTAHFHAIYGQWELIVGIALLRIIQGDAPLRVRDMVLEWAAEHQRELIDDWNRCSVAIPPRRSGRCNELKFLDSFLSTQTSNQQIQYEVYSLLQTIDPGFTRNRPRRVRGLCRR
jgi:hypothetical protein